MQGLLGKIYFLNKKNALLVAFSSNVWQQQQQLVCKASYHQVLLPLPWHAKKIVYIGVGGAPTVYIKEDMPSYGGREKDIG
jgi:hypothetical protein